MSRTLSLNRSSKDSRLSTILLGGTLRSATFSPLVSSLKISGSLVSSAFLSFSAFSTYTFRTEKVGAQQVLSCKKYLIKFRNINVSRNAKTGASALKTTYASLTNGVIIFLVTTIYAVSPIPRCTLRKFLFFKTMLLQNGNEEIYFAFLGSSASMSSCVEPLVHALDNLKKTFCHILIPLKTGWIAILPFASVSKRVGRQRRATRALKAHHF